MPRRRNTTRIIFTVISVILLISMILGFVIMLVPPS
jgi:preprotein translocase subunit SecE